MARGTRRRTPSYGATFSSSEAWDGGSADDGVSGADPSWDGVVDGSADGVGVGA